MSIVWDVKSIRLKLERNEQKAEFEEKNPKPDPNKVVWSPEWGYGMAPFGLAQDAYAGNVQNQNQAAASEFPFISGSEIARQQAEASGPLRLDIDWPAILDAWGVKI